MVRKDVINRILILIVICCGVELEGICQIKVVSTNYKEGNNIGYYRRSNPQDTVLVIFNSEHSDVEKSLRR